MKILLMTFFFISSFSERSVVSMDNHSTEHRSFPIDDTSIVQDHVWKSRSCDYSFIFVDTSFHEGSKGEFYGTVIDQNGDSVHYQAECYVSELNDSSIKIQIVRYRIDKFMLNVKDYSYWNSNLDSLSAEDGYYCEYLIYQLPHIAWGKIHVEDSSMILKITTLFARSTFQQCEFYMMEEPRVGIKPKMQR